MANEEHLEILKQGVAVWNRWRMENPKTVPDLYRASLDGAHLFYADHQEDDRISANLSRACLDSASLVGARLDAANLADASLVGAQLDLALLSEARLNRARLGGAHLVGAYLDYGDLERAQLDGAWLDRARLLAANLEEAHCDRTRFEEACLMGSSLIDAQLIDANLKDADLREANFDHASLVQARLDGARFEGALFSETILMAIDLKNALGLEQVEHRGPSIIDNRTLVQSQGQIPGAFLRGCGLSDWEIEAVKLHRPLLSTDELTDITYEIHRLKGESPIQINPLFISYSHADTLFVEVLEMLLDNKHIRYWRDVHNLKAGRLETQIERAIRHNPIVLLVLSEASAESDWVEWEVSKARELEKAEKRDVLCPVALDDAWKTCSWPGPLRRQIEDYNILDFSEWQDDAAMERQFKKLIEGLGMFYLTAQ